MASPCTGYSPKSGPDLFLPGFKRFLGAGGMFYREGSGALGLCYVAAGRLVGFFEPVIRSWDALGAIAVCEGAGAQVSDFLANDGLFKRQQPDCRGTQRLWRARGNREG